MGYNFNGCPWMLNSLETQVYGSEQNGWMSSGNLGDVLSALGVFPSL